MRDYSKIADNTLLLVKVAQEKCKEAGAALAAHASRGPPQLDLRTLEGVAKARFVLIHVAEFMFRGCEDGDATWEKAEMRIELGILFEEARRMCDNCSSPVPRVYLLKQLARRFGLGSIQRLAQVRNLAWILPPKDRTRQVSMVFRTPRKYAFDVTSGTHVQYHGSYRLVKVSCPSVRPVRVVHFIHESYDPYGSSNLFTSRTTRTGRLMYSPALRVV